MTVSPSQFIWYELCTTNVRKAADFYGAVLGWTTRDSGHDGTPYRTWLSGPESIGGILEITPDMALAGMEDGWIGYLSVADVDATVARIVAAGGHSHMAQTVPGVGRFSMVSDPQGAIFYVMTAEPGVASTAFAPRKVGHGGWHELHTKDADAAAGFYPGLFDWTADMTVDMGEMGTYRTFNGGGEPIVGMFNSHGMPRPLWLYYFNVEDIDAGKARVEAAGGKVHAGPHPVPTGQWMIQGSDPEGARFGLLGDKA